MTAPRVRVTWTATSSAPTASSLIGIVRVWPGSIAMPVSSTASIGPAGPHSSTSTLPTTSATLVSTKDDACRSVVPAPRYQESSATSGHEVTTRPFPGASWPAAYATPPPAPSCRTIAASPVPAAAVQVEGSRSVVADSSPTRVVTSVALPASDCPTDAVNPFCSGQAATEDTSETSRGPVGPGSAGPITTPTTTRRTPTNGRARTFSASTSTRRCTARRRLMSAPPQEEQPQAEQT